ncbi:hypothetical protein IEU95_14590 [Hoyosella rhizosphaerae]|uniref:Uncharacterized protein n=1 Tax=Hoyosella rhizosphaerae TaxID=1755582 RepID=A0A916UHI5_9ACTN|nr:hypothetical protein [Hoyosella rhizosphaerae]MBN4928066.1 hypothetical protein [Hoyosella rhizosphaerae]GGC72132.1 hypothetical protein GCM10011410_26450 [Hoyosella rhizosphaerae]
MRSSHWLTVRAEGQDYHRFRFDTKRRITLIDMAPTIAPQWFTPRTRNRAVVAVPLVVAIAAGVLFLTWLPSLPDSIVTGWASEAEVPTTVVTASSVVWSYLLAAAVTIALTVLGLLVEARAVVARVTVGCAWGIIAFITVATVDMLSAHRGISSGDEVVQLPEGGLLTTVGLAAVSACIGAWLVVPTQRS